MILQTTCGISARKSGLALAKILPLLCCSHKLQLIQLFRFIAVLRLLTSRPFQAVLDVHNGLSYYTALQSHKNENQGFVH